MEVVLETLTPLWTGGIDSVSDRVHETGLIGSLRWWYEAIIRALGGSACDPTKQVCNEKKWCDVCDLFGVTGLQRAFRLEVDNFPNPSKNDRLTVKVKTCASSVNRGWYLGQGIINSNLHLQCTPLRKPPWAQNDEWLHSIGLAFKLASKLGGIGIRTQTGYGVVNLKSLRVTSKEWDITKALQATGYQQKRSKRRMNGGEQLPDLRQFFFAKCRFPKPPELERFLLSLGEFQNYRARLPFYLENGVLPISPIIRYHLRALLRQYLNLGAPRRTPNAAARWQVMGVVNGTYHHLDYGKCQKYRWHCLRCEAKFDRKPYGDQHASCPQNEIIQEWECLSCSQWVPKREVVELERRGSLVNVSHAYLSGNEYEFRIWGWLPEVLDGGAQKEDVIKLISHSLGRQNYSAQYPHITFNSFWRFFSVNVTCEDWREFNSTRDIVQQFSDPIAYLRSLVSNHVV